jgi:hypothetical protein
MAILDLEAEHARALRVAADQVPGALELEDAAGGMLSPGLDVAF